MVAKKQISEAIQLHPNVQETFKHIHVVVVNREVGSYLGIIFCLFICHSFHMDRLMEEAGDVCIHLHLEQ